MRPPPKRSLTILMPCLNEAETIGVCVSKAKRFLDESGIDGEVLIADNGSEDGSQVLATDLGARVINVPQRGYGAALIAGIHGAKTDYIAMGDADDSYDFLSLDPFVAALDDGADLVMGNRFKGGIEPGAMPFLHRYLGNPVLSFIGRLFFQSPIGDFHCGLRAFRRESIKSLNLRAPGMEFASEMVVKATVADLDIREVPTKLHQDGRSRKPHLNTWSDGWRHLKFLLTFSPKWLFLYPGMTLFSIGLAAMITLALHIQDDALVFFGLHFGVSTMALSGGLIVVGFQLVYFWLVTRHLAAVRSLIPPSQLVTRIRSAVTLERQLLSGVLLIAVGLGVIITATLLWQSKQYGAEGSQYFTFIIPAITAILTGVQILFGAFLIFMIDE